MFVLKREIKFWWWPFTTDFSIKRCKVWNVKLAKRLGLCVAFWVACCLFGYGLIASVLVRFVVGSFEDGVVEFCGPVGWLFVGLFDLQFVWVCWLEFVVQFCHCDCLLHCLGCFVVCEIYCLWKFKNCLVVVLMTKPRWGIVKLFGPDGRDFLLVSLFVESVSCWLGFCWSWKFGGFEFLKFRLFEFCLVGTFNGQFHKWSCLIDFDPSWDSNLTWLGWPWFELVLANWFWLVVLKRFGGRL